MKAAMFLLALCAGVISPAQADTFIVTTADNTDDAKPYDPAKPTSLRKAIRLANSNPGRDWIDFNISGGGVATILPATPLPMITDPVVINGYSQAGATPNSDARGNNAVLMVEINGQNTPDDGNSDGLVLLQVSNCEIRGLIINGFAGEGININNGSNTNIIAGNWIGLRADGQTAGGRGQNDGIYVIGSKGNRLGGVDPADRNVISGNGQEGVFIFGGNSTGNRVLGNFIGTDAWGQTAVGNKLNGVDFQAPNNSIGDGTTGGRNIVSGNEGYGVAVFAYYQNGVRHSHPTVITGNFIGLDVTGDVMLPNQSDGVCLADVDQCTIGGETFEAGNVISGNRQFGISVHTAFIDQGLDRSGVSASSNIIQCNLVGTDATGLQARGNSKGGIYIDSQGSAIAAGNHIGGIKGGQRLKNIISGNQGDGIQLSGANTTNNVIEGNFIGLDLSGTRGLGNGGEGLWIGHVSAGSGSPGPNRIGGDDPSGLAGNVISSNKFNGIGIAFEPSAAEPFGGGHTIQGNLIGTDVTGLVAMGNEKCGIALTEAAGKCLIGGTTPLARNIISANQQMGIALLGTRNETNRIQGNYIGTDITGGKKLGNGMNGVDLGSLSGVNGTMHNVVGGFNPGEGNIISGNAGAGLLIANGSYNEVQGNSIGLNASGLVLGNDGMGVWLNGTIPTLQVGTNYIGGSKPGAGNLICGNAQGGVVIEGTNAIGNILQGNLIGTDAAAKPGLGNLGPGIRIYDASNTVVGTGPATITPAAGEANWIANNAGNGINVSGLNATIGNCFRANRVFRNLNKGIVIGLTADADPDLDVPNHRRDAAVSGPNEAMNRPTCLTARRVGVNTTFSGRVDTTPALGTVVDIYVSQVPSPIGGEEYLVSAPLDASGRFCVTKLGDWTTQSITATATSPKGSTSEYAAKGTLRLRALEFVQSVQDWSNSIPVFAGKTTFVRAHLETMNGLINTRTVEDLKPRLHATSLGTEFSDSPGGTLTVHDITIEPDATQKRELADHGVLFPVPEAWCAGTVNFWFEGNGVTCDEFDPAEPDCKDCGLSVTFQTAPRFELEVVDVTYDVSNPTTRLTSFANTAPDLDYMAALFKAMYPVSHLTRSDRVLQMNGTTPLAKSPEPAEVNERILKTRSLWSRFGNQKSLGVIAGRPTPDASGSETWGQAAGIPSDVASTYYTLPFGLYRAVPTHEVGHTLGLEHSVTKPNLWIERDAAGAVIATHPNYYEGKCGEIRAVAGPPLFPYGLADDTPSLGPMNGTPEELVYGLDLTGASPEIVDPTKIADLMSYCYDGQLGLWPSKYNYERMQGFLTSAFGVEGLDRSSAPRLQPMAVAQPALIVRGSVNLWAGTARFTPFSYWPGPRKDSALTPGEFRLDLLDASGAVLSSTAFEPIVYDIENVAHLRGGFIIPVPANPSYRIARGLRRGVVLATRTATAHPPVITSLSPDGGEMVNDQPVTISWTAEDADGDPLTYDVQFSGDGGLTWTGLEADLTANRLVVPRHTLPGSTRALVRVVASDGFNTAVRTSSAFFKLSDLPPRLRLVSPTPGQQFQSQQQILLRAEADDPQDGPLGTTNIVWQSDLDGRLGTGALFLRNASSLQSGLHQLTVTAWNQSGRSNSATVAVTVGTGAASSADLGLETAFSEPFAYVGSNIIQVCRVHNAGADWAADVRLNNTIPSGLKLVSATVSQGTWQDQNGTVLATLGDLEADAEATVTLSFIGMADGTFTNRVLVSSTTPDPLPANNESTRLLTVYSPDLPQPDLVVSFAETPSALPVGGTGDFLIEVLNRGSATATGVVLTNWLPAGLTLLSAGTLAGGQLETGPGQVVAHFNSLPGDAVARLRLHVALNSPDPLLVQAAAASAEPDAEPLDNLMTSIVTAGTDLGFSVTLDSTGIHLSWPDGQTQVIEQSDRLGGSASWRAVDGTPVLDQGLWRITVQPMGQTRFYRLRQP